MQYIVLFRFEINTYPKLFFNNVPSVNHFFGLDVDADLLSVLSVSKLFAELVPIHVRSMPGSGGYSIGHY